MTLDQLGNAMSAEEFGLWLADDALRRQPHTAAPREIAPEAFFEEIERGR